MQIDKMKSIVEFIKSNYRLTSIPVRVKNEKRWESIDEIIVREAFEGIPHRVNFNDGYGVIIYSWDSVEDTILDEIRVEYSNLK